MITKKMLNRSGPKIGPWETPKKISSQVLAGANFGSHVTIL